MRPAANASKLVPGGGLAAHENLGGHTLTRHVGLSDGQLLARLAEDPALPAASTFASRAVAELSVGQALSTASSQITRWLSSGTSAVQVVVARTNAVVGRAAFHDGSVVEATSIRIVLVRDPGAPLGYFIRTSYPIP
jgi:filamentous hemagglutinin